MSPIIVLEWSIFLSWKYFHNTICVFLHLCIIICTSIMVQRCKSFQLSAAELCPQCGVIVDSCVRYSESPHQSLCNGLQQANKPELSSVPSFFFTHLGYSLLWCKFTHYFKLHRQSGEGRVCSCRGRGWSGSVPLPHLYWHLSIFHFLFLSLKSEQEREKNKNDKIREKRSKISEYRYASEWIYSV